MPLRRGTPVRVVLRGCSDAVDGTNTFPGAAVQLADLVPDPSTNGCFVPRPAAFKIIDFAIAGFSSPGFISSLLVVGNLAYGTIATSRNAGKDEPFVVNLLTGSAVTVAGITSANVPSSPPATGKWTPPILAQVGSRVIVTHPGFPGGAVKFGWFDVSGFTTTLAVTTHTTDTLDGFTTPLGTEPGMTVTGPGIPAGATILSSTASSIKLSAAATASASVNVTIAGGTIAAPLWGAGDTDRNPLPSVPVGVAQFYGRAYYALGLDGIVFSDSGFACRVSNTTAVQALLPGNGLPITAIAPLMLSSSLATTGIVQALIAFQNISGMQQILGDLALNNLTMNALPVATGTAAPLSITPCEFGTAFISPEGLRIVQFNATVSEPIGDAGSGITVPYIYSAVPSRMCVSANSHVLRGATLNAYTAPIAGDPPAQEWWFDLGRKVWTGPMSIVPSLIQPWQGANNESTFIMAPIGILGSLWRSDPYGNLASSYTENGVAMNWTAQPTPLPDTGQMAMNEMVEMSVAGAFLTKADLTANDISGVGLGTTQVPPQLLPPPSIWGVMIWGSSLWGGGATKFQQWPVYWSAPLVFKQLDLTIRGASGFGVKLGNLSLRYQITGYPLPVPGGPLT
jgi:hypothetical protein